MLESTALVWDAPPGQKGRKRLREEGRRIGGVAFEGGVVGLLGSGEAEKDLAVWSTEEVEMVVGLEVKAW